MRVNGKFIIFIACFILLGGSMTGCAMVKNPEQVRPSNVPTLPQVSRTPFQPAEPTVLPLTPTATPNPIVGLGLHPGVPERLRNQITLVPGTEWAGAGKVANVVLSPIEGPNEGSVCWVYALVAPFGTVEDSVQSETLIAIWNGVDLAGRENVELFLTPTTKSAIESLWGTGSDQYLRIAGNQEDLILHIQQNPSSLAIVPFDELIPEWKVLKIDDLSPLQRDFPQDAYSLSVNFGWMGSVLTELPTLPASNRLEEKMTVITMTGVTALVRATGFMMDMYGMTFPGEDIREWMIEADFTHVSNEVSFDQNCPAQDPNQQGLRFCSRPEYIELLEYVGVDVVELTGNHLMDFRPESLPFTMEMYRQRGWQTFGGGENLEVASQPALVEHHGNRIAFVGCNPAGPGGDWAGAGNAGTQPCNWEVFRQEIHELTNQGYMVIATLQYFETYVSTPSSQQIADFRSLSEVGAVIVSGSQAHFPQGFDFVDGRFIHYGLGNLFFDQMDYPVVGTRREFLDRHVFYDGKHISTELLTAMLENYARPRPMNDEERRNFLNEMFLASGW